jgi:Peptidase family U32
VAESMSTRDFLAAVGLPRGDLSDAPSSSKRFPDGAQFRIEIPSTEGPASLRAVLDEATRRGVLVHRVSQGSGVLLLTDAELRDMAATARDARIEVSLAARPHAAWGTSAMARSPAGALIGSSAHGAEQVVQQLDDARRAAAHGFRSVLITDVGTLAVFDAMKREGLLPRDMSAKISVLLAVANPSAARVMTSLGAGTLNVPTDLTIGQLAAIRSATDLPLDIYIESADEFGGFLRYGELPDLIRVASPVYLKFGLRNAPDVYPSGTHLDAVVTALSRERVRRAEIALELIGRQMPDAVMSAAGASGLALVAAESDRAPVPGAPYDGPDSSEASGVLAGRRYP